MEVDDIRRLSEVAPFAWSRYALDQQNDVFVYKQTIGAAAGRDVGNVGWNGDELVAFRLHLPSRVPFHNSPTREIERGNIIVWEQPLAGPDARASRSPSKSTWRPSRSWFAR